MKTFDRLDALYRNPPLRLTINGPCVFGSDDHRGDGGPADDNWPNKEKCGRVKEYYLNRGYTYFILGDHEDLWQFDKNEIEMIYRKPDPRLIYLGGNHDAARKYPEACLLTHQGQEYFLCHGHPGDLFSDRLWKIGRWAARYPWKWAEELGVKEPPSSIFRHEAQRKALCEWANDREVTSIFGHIHFAEHEGKYWNCGSRVMPGTVECIELKMNDLKLRQW